jgi:hypothetical protein
MAANPKVLPPYPISITGTTPDPKSVKIDSDGSIQFTSSDECTIEWKDEHGKKGTFWSSQPGKITKGVNGVQDALPSADHRTLTYTLDNGTLTQGGGTIKVGS